MLLRSAQQHFQNEDVEKQGTFDPSEIAVLPESDSPVSEFGKHSGCTHGNGIYLSTHLGSGSISNKIFFLNIL